MYIYTYLNLQIYVFDTRRASDFGRESEFSLYTFVTMFPCSSGTQFPAAGGKMLKGRTAAGTKQPFVTAIQLLFIFTAAQNTGQCLCLDFFFFLLKREGAFQPGGGREGGAPFLTL